MTEQEELLSIFIEESNDLLERIRERMDQFQLASDRDERFKDILRSIHTIKGGSGTCGFNRLKNQAHQLEERLLAFKDMTQQIPDELINDLERTVEDFSNLLSAGPDPASSEHKHHEAFGLFDDESPTAQETAKPDALAHPVASSSIPTNAAVKTPETVRVPLEKIQRNIDLVSEIFLTRNQIKYLVEKRSTKELSEPDFQQQWEVLDNTLRKSIGDLENLAMSLRMMPIKPVFRMMKATVQDYVKHSGKQIILEVEGEDTDLDKRVLDSLSEPLIHLVRNAMDHGIEDQETRQSLGKPIPAIIRLVAQLEGNEVIITISDDGKGIDDKIILESARNKGLDVSNVRTKEDAVNLIFHPGFSTKQEATEVSGRGIGMDAVKNFVESIGGILQVNTEINRGSKFCMRIPLGLSVIRVLIARVNGVSFAISSSEVMEIKRISKTELQRNGNEFFFLKAAEFIPCHNLGDYIYTQIEKGYKVQNQSIAICNIIYQGELVSLQVDELVSNAEIVVKPMPDQGLSRRYITGVAILPDGKPTFVISLPRLYETLIKDSKAKKSGASHAA